MRQCVSFAVGSTALMLVLSYCSSKTVKVDTQDCFGLPQNPITLAGAFVANSRLPGRTTCYFGPSESGQYLSMRFSTLLLPRKASSCPTLTINEYSSVREELIDDTDPNLRVPMVIPADPKQLFRSDCTNYEKMLEQVVRTSAPGLRIEMIFEPMNADLTDVSYTLIITSFLIGPSFNCPSGTFRCWSDRSRCIPESLTCDGIDNCFDDSDENNYLCTGRINGIPIPLFAIIIVGKSGPCHMSNSAVHNFFGEFLLMTVSQNVRPL
ncbi:hypothetical protein CRM22_006348 [Opisthorchis felineus]|uniref:CUB domain-containing protein n=1 Tax=Opisthorchis felineus TaxID=147828 RepID=A0A4S2LLI2_OPIFE|nr:hypothetical protein CRM22_006348 [Opisthorchis felineus]